MSNPAAGPETTPTRLFDPTKAKATLRLEFHDGSSIEPCFREAGRISTLLGVNTLFTFNGIECTVRGDQGEGHPTGRGWETFWLWTAADGLTEPWPWRGR